MFLFVVELKEVCKCDEANLFLKKGWKLIMIENGNYILGRSCNVKE